MLIEIDLNKTYYKKVMEFLNANLPKDSFKITEYFEVDETEYLNSTKANREHLEKSIEEFKEHKFVIKSLKELDIK